MFLQASNLRAPRLIYFARNTRRSSEKLGPLAKNCGTGYLTYYLILKPVQCNLNLCQLVPHATILRYPTGCNLASCCSKLLPPFFISRCSVNAPATLWSEENDESSLINSRSPRLWNNCNYKFWNNRYEDFEFQYFAYCRSCRFYCFLIFQLRFEYFEATSLSNVEQTRSPEL